MDEAARAPAYKTPYHVTACVMAKPPRSALKREILNAAARVVAPGRDGAEHEGILGDFAQQILASEASLCRKFVGQKQALPGLPWGQPEDDI